ncbi:MAG: carbamoyl phosphate synthase small subunit [Pelagibacteraceae bacterium]|nr:carbamoyl phosphate synthase small subunit [Pelagibacteraceae bacterium]
MALIDNSPKDNYQEGYLIYDKNNVFKGKFLSSKKSLISEICFNTSMTGYQEIITDPSYKSQFITFTFPLIGIVGTNNEDYESWKIHCSGIIIKELIEDDSNWRSNQRFFDWIVNQNSSAFWDIDTRALTYLIRNKGPKNVMMCTKSYFESKTLDEILLEINNFKKLEDTDVINSYTNELKKTNHNINGKFKVAFLDFGAKDNIKKSLINRNCHIEEYDMNFSAKKIINNKYNGLFLSNGPGDPKKIFQEIKNQLNLLIDTNIPIFGICLGHQILCLALGAETKRMEKGHRGANHPVKNLKTQKVEITSQNHGFVVSEKNFPKEMEVTHLSLFDKTIDGMKSKKHPLFSVQYHPESSPGPHDSRYLFDNFIETIKKHAS